MKKIIAGTIGALSLGVLTMVDPVGAAELLDVKPLVSGSNVVIEVTADIPMTYTYYKVPGQARAVVDIADADPEKVEPLIVVNKGAVASISVDKAMISDMTVSRLIFNLVSESDINVVHSGDRKQLSVSFGGAGVAAAPAAVVAPPPTPVAEPVATPEPKKVEVVKPVEPPAAAKAEEDPLGLDEPKTSPAPAAPVSPAKTSGNPLTKEEEDPLGLDEPKGALTVRTGKLQPVVPVAVEPVTSGVVVKGIIVGSSYIDIQTSADAEKIKHMKLVKPDRLAIDIPGTSTIKVKSIAVNKFGISKMRIGKNSGVVRIVLDSVKTPFPEYTVDSSDSRVRISFK